MKNLFLIALLFLTTISVQSQQVETSETYLLITKQIPEAAHQIDGISKLITGSTSNDAYIYMRNRQSDAFILYINILQSVTYDEKLLNAVEKEFDTGGPSKDYIAITQKYLLIKIMENDKQNDPQL